MVHARKGMCVPNETPQRASAQSRQLVGRAVSQEEQWAEQRSQTAARFQGRFCPQTGSRPWPPLLWSPTCLAREAVKIPFVDELLSPSKARLSTSWSISAWAPTHHPGLALAMAGEGAGD
jgi:hypothetical protein